MASLSGKKGDDDRVRLIGFATSSPVNSKKFPRRAKSNLLASSKAAEQSHHPSHLHPLTITANARVSPRRQDSLPSPLSEKVKLVKFEFNEEDRVPAFFNYSNMEHGLTNGRLNGTGTVGLGISGGSNSSLLSERLQQREEKMERMKKESQDWFSKVREENHKWRRGYSSSSFGDPEDRMKNFFEEAQKKFSSGNQEIFTRFMQDNRERFADILEDQNRGFFQPDNRVEENGSTGSRPSSATSSYQGPKRPNSLASETSATSYSDESTFSEKTANGGGTGCFSNGGRSTPKFPKRSPTSPVDQPFRENNKFNQERIRDGTSGGERSTNPTNFLSSPVRVGPGRMATYHMSKSTFEYCGISNSYRFHTEQITRNYEHGYESISESEDEEDEECESVEDATSTQGTASELDEESITTQEFDARSDSGCLLAAEYESKKDKVQQTLHKIATELLTTERTYVSILHLLDQVFAFRVDQENRVHHMFSQDVVAQMFCNLKSLYKLHHDFLLPLLEERLAKWDTEPRIGDIMKNFAPFLKMYTEYVKNYDNAMGLINSLYQKQPHFAQIMDEIHTLDECGHLTLQHHMLTPVQRVPRYQLLLKDYLKKLPENSPDRADTEKALELVSTAAIHANEAMKKNDKIKKLLEIQEMIGGVVDLVSPSRELLKEGKIIKISARSGDHQERHLFLFNDLLLLCSQRRIANRVVSGPIFRVRARLEVEGLTVEEGDNLETANSFYIRHVGRSVELYTHTLEEKQRWMEAFAKAVHELTKRKSSLKSPEGLELGKRAPTFVRVESVTHCMSCGRHFNAFSFKWKHHCHACGIVACGKCLVRKVPLPCEKLRSCRVCNSCYETLVAINGDDSTLKYAGSPTAMTPDSPPPTSFGSPESPVRHRSVLDVKPHDQSVVCGYLQLKARSRTWTRRWFALHIDFVLYSFATEHDERALTSMPVPGYTVNLPSKGESGLDGRDNVFKLSHQKKVYFFQSGDAGELQRWLSALQMASRAESPS